MKRQTMGAVVILSLLVAAAADAAMVTLPEDPQSGHRLSVAIDYENTLHRELNGASATDNEVKRYDAAYARFQFAAHALLNAYARVGSGRATHRIEDRFISNVGHRDLTFESERALAWGAGLTGGTKLPWGFKVGYDVNYHAMDAGVNHVEHNNDDAPAAAQFTRSGSGISGDLQWQEYQAAVWVAHSFESAQTQLTPYIGGKWSHLTLADEDVKYNVTDAGTTQSITVNDSSDNTTRWGAVLGIRVVYNQRLVIVLEGHEIDDESVLGSVSWRF